MVRRAEHPKYFEWEGQYLQAVGQAELLQRELERRCDGQLTALPTAVLAIMINALYVSAVGHALRRLVQHMELIDNPEEDPEGPG